MHLSRIYKVLNAKSRTDALAKYNRLRSGARRPASEKGS
jgi:DNA-binding CsgD family transcriptional regulator